MQMGKVVAVQDNSPAAEAGLKAGDFIESITAVGAEDEAKSLIRDPLTLPETLRMLAARGSRSRSSPFAALPPPPTASSRRKR